MVFSLGRKETVGKKYGHIRAETTHCIEEPSNIIISDHKDAFSPMTEFVYQGKGMHSLVKASRQASEDHDGMLLRQLLRTWGRAQQGRNRTYLDMPLRLLIFNQRANAFHEIGCVLVAILYDANAT